MKELSIEEKARRYDGAIKRLEDIETGKCQKTFMFTEGLFDFIFPELKESEDERIRKEIIAHIKWCEDSGYCAKEEMTRWIAWLEKQGQVKESLISQHENKMCKESDDSLTSEDEEIRKVLLELISTYLRGNENGKIHGVYAKDILAWLERQVQKPAAWSEEDTRLLDNCISLIEDIDCTEEEQNWLKSLKDRVQQQSQWKPSEEQLKSLKEVIDVGYFTSYPNTLETLYEQLKKLIEE